MRFGARNQLVGTVTAVKKGGLMALVKVQIPAKSEIASVMTSESLGELKLKRGDKVVVLMKAVSVLLGK